MIFWEVPVLGEKPLGTVLQQSRGQKTGLLYQYDNPITGGGKKALGTLQQSRSRKKGFFYQCGSTFTGEESATLS
jgi:hypothetical protein